MSEIIYKGAHPNNYAVSRHGEIANEIIVHISQTATNELLAGWFNNPNAGVSSHYGVGDDSIYQFVKDESAAYANGGLNKANMSIPWVASCAKDGPAFGAKYGYGIPNARSLSIENVGYSGKPVSDSHWQNLVWLVAKLCTEHNIPVDAQHIIRHADLDSVNRANCPGSTFDMTKLIKDVQMTMQPAFKVGDGVLAAMVAKGDQPAGDEYYFSVNPNQASGDKQVSRTPSKLGFLYEAIQGADGAWRVEVYQQV